MKRDDPSVESFMEIACSKRFVFTQLLIGLQILYFARFLQKWATGYSALWRGTPEEDAWAM